MTGDAQPSPTDGEIVEVPIRMNFFYRTDMPGKSQPYEWRLN
jgi:hypothetical protein